MIANRYKDSIKIENENEHDSVNTINSKRLNFNKMLNQKYYNKSKYPEFKLKDSSDDILTSFKTKSNLYNTNYNDCNSFSSLDNNLIISYSNKEFNDSNLFEINDDNNFKDESGRNLKFKTEEKTQKVLNNNCSIEYLEKNNGNKETCKIDYKYHSKFIDAKSINEFLKRENLTEKDLKDLEKKISQKIKSKKSNDELTKKLISGTKPQIVELNEEKKVENENINPQILNENIQNEQKQDLNTSAMSGGSDLEKFDGKYAKEEMDASELKELEKYKNSNNEPTVKKVVLDTNKYNDEWDAINMYQKRMFQERERREKTKELEMKMRNRADLLNQIQQKIKRKYDEELKDKEYAIIIEQNVKKMDELERKQKEAKKQQILKEKEIRDKQLRDIYVAKRIAFLKNKKYEKELIEHNNEEIRLAKEAALIQKEKEHDALLKTLKDNELHKQKILEQERIERENDIKIMEDAAANEIKKENERKAYYESIKRGQAEHDTKILESVIKKRNEQLKEEENILNNFWKNQGVLDRENEIRRKIEMKENQKKLKMFYDKQVEEKKAKKEFERQVDLAQGRIWKQDYLNYLQYENDTSRRIKEMIRKNMSALNNQPVKKNIDDGMSENEKAMNKEMLEKAMEQN